MHTTKRNSGWWSGIMVGAVSLGLLAALWSTLATTPPAYAQFGDAAAQRAEMIKEQRATNAKLDEIAKLLREIRDEARQKKDDKKSAQPAPQKP